jgi:hypothetical protein
VSSTATCPGKLRVVGGGFTTSTTAPDSLVLVHSSLRASKRAWISSAVGHAGGSLTTHAYCRRLGKVPTDVAVTVTTAPVHLANNTALAICPRKRKLLSGGFSSTQGPTGFDFAVPLASLNRGGGGWSYTAANNTDVSHTLTSHAYCAKGLKRPKLTTGSNSSGSEPTGGTVSASSAACPRRQLSAGGFNESPQTAAGTTPYVTQSRIDGSGWAATTINTGVPGPVSLETQGICF